MEELKSLIGGEIHNNIIYIIVCIVLAYIGIKITKKIIRIVTGLIFLVFTLFKLAIRLNLINLTSLIK